MTENQVDNDKRLREIMESAKNSHDDIAKLIAEALPMLGDRLHAPERLVLEHNLNGFDIQTGIDYYLKAPLDKYEGGYMPHRTMPHRERPGRIFVLAPDGSEKPVMHEIGRREEFFVSAPAARLQELANTQSSSQTIELPELTSLIGEEEGGRIMLEIEQTHLAQMAKNCRKSLAHLIDIALTPALRDGVDRLNADMAARQRARKSKD